MKQRDDWHLTEDLHYSHGRADPFAAAVRATRMAMVITDPGQADNPIVFANEAFQKLTGYDRSEIIGRNCRFLQGPHTDRASVAELREAVEHGESIEIDLLNYRRDGSTFWNALYMSPVRNDAGIVQFFFASQLDVTERVEAQAEISKQKAAVEREVRRRTADLQAALEAKTLLLHEVDHRVKNNLTMIGSLLRLQTRTIQDPAITDKLGAMLERIDALASIHRRMYQSDDVTLFDVGAFAANLVEDMIGATGRENIALQCDVERIDIPSGKAAPLGLVLNEVLTNAVKHGYRDGRSGVLKLGALRHGDMAVIHVADDGPGMNSLAQPGGLGRILIKRLSHQIGAKAEWSDACPGTRVTITFPVVEVNNGTVQSSA